MGQNKAVPLNKAACRIQLQNCESQHSLRRFCVPDQALEQITTKALILVNWKHTKLVNGPTI
jgi:hypothetical protein